MLLKRTILVIGFISVNILALSSLEGTVSEMICPGPGIKAPCYTVPLEGCTVLVLAPISSKQFEAVTDDQGRYFIDSIIIVNEYVPYTVIAYKEGYEQESRQIEFVDGASATADFYMDNYYGTLTVIPQNPKDIDSLYFSLFSLDICCCAVYSNHAVTFDDTAIYLNYTVDASMCAACFCLMQGSTTYLESGPVPAGNYSVYKVENSFCQGGICQPVALIPEKIGNLTITSATDLSSNIIVQSKKSRFTLTANSKNVSLFYNKKYETDLKVSVFTAQGKLVKELYAGIFSPKQTLQWDYTGSDGSSVSPGVYYFSIRENGKIVQVVEFQVH